MIVRWADIDADKSLDEEDLLIIRPLDEGAFESLVDPGGNDRSSINFLVEHFFTSFPTKLGLF